MAIYVVVNHLWKWSLARAYFRGRGIPTRRMGGARAADAERAVVVDDGGTRSAAWARFTSANAASAAASVGGAPAGLLVGSLLRDASPALFFIVSACEAGTAAR